MDQKRLLKKLIYVGNNYFVLNTIVLFSITTIVLTKRKFQEKQKKDAIHLNLLFILNHYSFVHCG